MRELIYPHVIRNASEYGKANSKAVLAKVLGESPDLRKRAREVMAEVEAVVSEVNSLSKDEIAKKAGEFSFEKRAEKEKGLTKLPDAVDGTVRLRFAPNPSGPLHLGHARAAILNDEYVKRYNGKLILRFEDTDPNRIYMGDEYQKQKKDAYKLIQEDLDWLGVKCDETVYQSSRLDLYYEHARKLLSKNKAYVCTCSQAEFKVKRESSTPCLCRDKKDSASDFEKMFSEYKEGEAVLRLKTDLTHKNVSIRDFPIMRIVEAEHPRVGDKKVYPLMNFSVPIDDHSLGLTHVLRGKDHILNTQKQAYIYDYFGWKKPVFIHYGLLNILYTVLSTSDIKKMREDLSAPSVNIRTDWDSPRFATLSGLKRRGIKPEAIRAVMLDVGVKQTDITFSWENLYAQNKKLVDPIANRYSFVDAPVIKDKSGKNKHTPFILKVTGCPEITVIKRLHPTADRGFRPPVKLESNSQDFLIGSDDFSNLKNGEFLRLMEAYNVKVLSINIEKNIVETEFQSLSLNEAREGKARLINWVKPDDGNFIVEVISSDEPSLRRRTSIIGLAEKAVENDIGNVVQFERYGFVRLEKDKPRSITAVFSHY